MSEMIRTLGNLLTPGIAEFIPEQKMPWNKRMTAA